MAPGHVDPGQGGCLLEVLAGREEEVAQELGELDLKGRTQTPLGGRPEAVQPGVLLETALGQAVGIDRGEAAGLVAAEGAVIGLAAVDVHGLLNGHFSHNE